MCSCEQSAATAGDRLLRPWSLCGGRVDSQDDLRNQDPSTLCRRLKAQLGQLYSSRCGDQVVPMWPTGERVTEKLLPLHLEGVVQARVARHFGRLAGASCS